MGQGRGRYNSNQRSGSRDSNRSRGENRGQSRDNRGGQYREMRRCFNCGRQGHISRFCRQPRRQPDRGNAQGLKDQKKNRGISFVFVEDNRSQTEQADAVAEGSNYWTLDSACSYHYTHHREWFASFEQVIQSV